MTVNKKKVDGKRAVAPVPRPRPPEAPRDDDAEWIAGHTDKLGAMAWAFCAALCKLIGVVFYALAVVFGAVDDCRDGSDGVPRKADRKRSN